MKLIHRLLSLFLWILLFSFIFIRPASADTITLSGSVQDSSGNAISGATVSVNDSNNDSTTTDSSGNYSLAIPSGTYNIEVTPPAGSGFSSAIAMNQNIFSNVVLNFVLTPAGSVTLSGHIYAADGTTPLQNQAVKLGTTTAYTDLSGAYSLQVSSGTYSLTITNFNKAVDGPNTPQVYTLTDSSYAINQDTTLDISLPESKVTMHVQDPSGNPVSGVGVVAENNATPTVSGLTFDSSNTSFNPSYAFPTTDENGNVDVWVLTNTSGTTTDFLAYPPSGSNYEKTTLSGIPITGNTNETINLVAPVTLSGHIYAADGVTPLANQTVELGSTSVYTDSSGAYSIQVSPGIYSLTLSDLPKALGGPDTPQSYTLTDSSYTINQNTTLDISLPESEVSMHVQDPSGNSVSGVGVVAENSVTPTVSGITFDNSSTSFNSSAAYPTADENGNVDVWVLTNTSGTTTDFTAFPPSGSNYEKTTLSGIPITGNTNETINLVAPVTLSGHIYAADGTTPLQNQAVKLGTTTAYTDLSGAYSLQVSSGTYSLTITNFNKAVDGPNTPQVYTLTDSSYAINQDTTLDISLPESKVTMHVQDPSGNPVSGVGVVAENNATPTVSGLTFDSSNTSFNPSYAFPTTDENGNVDVWVLTNTSGTTTDFLAYPPSGSNYNRFSLNNITVTGNQEELVQLEYNHATPVTTANLSPTSYSDGTYADPTTVTLSASAASGYTVANTYYTIDNGSPVTYSTPFTVTGAGTHTITYWSVDNSGVQEATNTKTFTITEAYNVTGTVYNDANQNGFQDSGEQGVSGATVTVSQNNQTVATTTTDSNGNYTFSNLEAGNYTETLTVPDGYTPTTTNPVSFPLESNTTENFGIAQVEASPVAAINAGGDTQGDFAADTGYNGGSTFITSATVDTSGVTNPAPDAVYQSVRYGNFSYTIPNLTANGTYTLQLHFSEPYWGTSQAGGGGVGSRIFNVSVNGTQELSDFDVYEAAGGANKAVMEQIPATADSNGNITITFNSVVDNAMVSGIAVYNGTLPSPSPTPIPTPVSFLAISAGGQGSGSYISDTDYTGGSTYNTSASIDTSGVTNPAPTAVYQSVRYGNFSYTIPTYNPNANYTVRLDFAEPYWNSAGSREFNVSINGTQVLNNFDVYQEAGGENKAVSETFTTTSDSNGLIKIQFSTVIDNAMVSGIQVSKQ